MSNIIPRRSDGLVKNLIQSAIIGLVLTTLSYGIGLGFGWIDGLSLLEAFAVFTSYSCTFLCVMERRINYPIGALSTAAYCILFLQYDLLASSSINAFLAVYLIYGWLRWRSDANSRPVTRMSGKDWLVHLLVAGIGYLAIVGLSASLGGTLAWTDSVIFAGTILAQFMLDNKKLETWIIWALVNVFAIYTYFTADLTLVGFQYIFFLANTAFGFWSWSDSNKYRNIQP